MVEEPSLRLVTYTVQRFASSPYNQWLKIERNFSGYLKVFEILYPNREENQGVTIYDMWIRFYSRFARPY